MIQNRHGFTLVELIVVMAIFLTVIMITASAFKNIANQSVQQSKSVESQIEGIVGLEVLRADLEQIGFGLPWELNEKGGTFSVNYDELDVGATFPAAFWPAGKSAMSFNDTSATHPTPPDNPPRAILSDNTTFNWDGSTNTGSKYLVIKSILAATNDASKKWTTVSFDQTGAKVIKTWGAPDRDFNATDQVIVVKNNLMSDPPTRQLMASSDTAFFSTFATYSSLIKNHQNGDSFEIYGVMNPSATATPRAPFNRADFYVKRPNSNMPTSCAESSGVGILYKGVFDHSSGGHTTIPLLDCVADLQVVYGLDTSNSGRVNQYSDAPAATASPTAEDIRSQLREIRVYILAQEGQKDFSYSYPRETVLVGEVLNGIQRGRLFNLNTLIGPVYKNYRWKVYTIVVRPKNIIQ